MIDFTTLKGLTIPEGNVTQIADANGNVLWKKAPSEATITIIGDTSSTIGGLINVTIDGQIYTGTCGTVELTVPIGTLVYCSATPNFSQAGRIYKGTSYIMGTVLADSAKGGTTPATYTYEVAGDTKFTLNVASFTANYVLITEL